MRTPKDFDYDLWTTEDGKRMVRVKATGEVTEVSREIMKLLRAEEKKQRREMEGIPISGSKTEKATLLSLDIISLENFSDNEYCPSWLVDNTFNPENIASVKELKKKFIESLSPAQREVFLKCFCGGMSCREYARKKNVDHVIIVRIAKRIRKKYLEVFGDLF